MNGLFILDSEAYERIYGEETTRTLSRMVRFPHPKQTRHSIMESRHLLRDVDVIFSGWGGPRMDEDFLAHAPNLKAVFYGAGSIRAMATEAFWQRGIAITTATAANAIPVAEFALSQILFCLKFGWQHNHWCKTVKRSDLLAGYSRINGPGAYSGTVGLVSFGTIARLLREHLRSHGVDVLVHDPFISSADAKRDGITLGSLSEVFERADVVSLHTPDLPETAGMIRGEHVRSMRKHASLINTARSRLVRHGELIEALRARPDLWAVLDVTETATDEEFGALQKLENVTLTPHIAGSGGMECRRMGAFMLEECRRFLAGEPLLYALDRKRAALLA